jgi:hypothetical protein
MAKLAVTVAAFGGMLKEHVAPLHAPEKPVSVYPGAKAVMVSGVPVGYVAAHVPPLHVYAAPMSAGLEASDRPCAVAVKLAVTLAPLAGIVNEHVAPVQAPERPVRV